MKNKPKFKENRGRPRSYAPPAKKGDVVVTKRTQAAVYAHAKKNGYKVRTWKHENVIYVERLS
jgi:hypothetical protein